MAVRLLQSILGTKQGHALQDFQDVAVGPIEVSRVDFPGATEAGVCSFGTDEFGQR